MNVNHNFALTIRLLDMAFETISNEDMSLHDVGSWVADMSFLVPRPGPIISLSGLPKTGNLLFLRLRSIPKNSEERLRKSISEAKMSKLDKLLAPVERFRTPALHRLFRRVLKADGLRAIPEDFRPFFIGYLTAYLALILGEKTGIYTKHYQWIGFSNDDESDHGASLFYNCHVNLQKGEAISFILDEKGVDDHIIQRLEEIFTDNVIVGHEIVGDRVTLWYQTKTKQIEGPSEKASTENVTIHGTPKDKKIEWRPGPPNQPA